MRRSPTRGRAMARWLTHALCGITVVGVSTSCRDAPPPARSGGGRPARANPDLSPPVSPGETIERMRALHAERNYDALRTYVAGDGRAAFVDTLMAMDEFLAANASLQDAIRPTMDVRLLPEWDLSPWADAMGIFAPRVTVITDDNDGMTAAIRYQIGDRVPLEDVKLHWVNDRWTYDPGDVLPDLAPAIRELSMTLNDLAQKVRRRPLSRDDLDAEFRLRVIPRLNRVLAAAATQPAAQDAPQPTTAPAP